MIEIQGLTKRFGKRLAVDDISLSVPAGSICGLLGHNGAGKSTTLGCLLGHVHPDAGNMRVGGLDVLKERRKAMARVGAIFEAPAFYDYLSGAQNLRMLVDASGPVSQNRLNEVVEWVGLKERIQERVSAYSHGMRQRLALAQALLPHPEILIVDEPTDGLDPEGIQEMRDWLLKLNREMGLTLLLSSHLLSEVEAICSHIAVMRSGKVLFQGELRTLPRPERWIILKTARPSETKNLLESKHWLDATQEGDRFQLKSGITLEMVVREVLESGHGFIAAHPLEVTLEDFYLETVRENRNV